MKQKLIFYCALLIALANAPACAQTRNFFNTPLSTSPRPPVSGESQSSSAPTGNQNKEEGEKVAASQSARPNVPLYDPSMDNRLKAPVSGMEIGLFGKEIKEVEEKMRFLGAKNHSYAFGKYSRMVLSVYLVTLYFDRDRRLGSVEVSPQPPYEAIGPEARRFFLETFFAGGDVSSFDIKIAKDKLELKYQPK